MLRTTIGVLVALLITAGALTASASAASAPAEKEFTAFSLADLNSLVAASKGKVVVVNFFASWCPPCREEIPGIIAIRNSISADKLVIIGLSVDENYKDLRKYAAKTNFTYPVHRAEADLVQWARVTSIPHMLIYDKTGKLLVSEAGLVSEQDLRNFLTKVLEQ